MMAPSEPYWPVRIEYTARQTVYVQAPTREDAHDRALGGPDVWASSEAPNVLASTVRLVENA